MAKASRRFVFTAVMALLAVPLVVQGQDGLCVVKGVMGTVKVYSPRDRKAVAGDVSTWPEARLNMPLREKDMVATLSESEVRLETADGSAVRLRENTTLEVAALGGGAAAISARLKLGDGSLVANVKKLAGGKSSFEFETPTSLAAIRGTTVELDSKKGVGTTLKTFDGKVEAGPSGKGKKRQAAEVGNYQMTEIAEGQQGAKVRAVPSFYRPKTTKLLSEEETAALTGFTRVILTVSELEDIKRKLEADGVACGIGIGEADLEMVARTVSSDNARTELAKGMGTQVQRISESYAQNINGEAKKVWEEGVRQITDVSVRGSSVHTTVTQFNAELKRFKVYSLMVLAPERFKAAFAGAANKIDEEFELRVKKDDMMDKMDASIRSYNTKYHDR